MLPDEVTERGQHTMTVCNACRYCEAYCPVFPAMEQRLTFAKADLAYLANLCHNCGECLYACQYAPPHEFGINVPRVLAEIRLASYRDFCWPRTVSGAFVRQGLWTVVAVAAGFAPIAVAAAATTGNAEAAGDFYRIIPHGVMVAIFAAVSVFVLSSLLIGRARFGKHLHVRAAPPAALAAARDALSLRHLHSSGVDCADSPDSRRPWRRWFHHATFYGFSLCFASTTVAAFYHLVRGWPAPYPYTSAPVVLGTLGGIGLIVGPVGLLILRRRRDEALGDPAQESLDTSFAILLSVTSATGLLLLAFRESAAMASLLIIHLALVLALFLMLPYGKFVHGIYRLTALVKFAAETSSAGSGKNSGLNPP